MGVENGNLITEKPAVVGKEQDAGLVTGRVSNINSLRRELRSEVSEGALTIQKSQYSEPFKSNSI